MSRIKEINKLTLEKHQGDYVSWPSRSKLFVDEEDVGKTLPGYLIEKQYLLSDGNYFLITSYDCPFEEQCDLILLDAQYNQLAKRSLSPWYYSSWNFESAQVLGDDKILLTFNSNYFLEITLKYKKLFSWRKIVWKRRKTDIEVN